MLTVRRQSLVESQDLRSPLLWICCYRMIAKLVSALQNTSVDSGKRSSMRPNKSKELSSRADEFRLKRGGLLFDTMRRIRQCSQCHALVEAHPIPDLRCVNHIAQVHLLSGFYTLAVQCDGTLGLRSQHERKLTTYSLRMSKLIGNVMHKRQALFSRGKRPCYCFLTVLFFMRTFGLKSPSLRMSVLLITQSRVRCRDQRLISEQLATG